LYSLETLADQLAINLTGPNGDADLYIKKWAVPSTDSYDCAPLAAASNESCVFTTDIDGAEYYANVDGFEAYSDAMIHAFVSRPMLLGTANNFITGDSNTSRSFWRVDVPAGKSQFRVKTTAIGISQNPNIYVRYLEAPLVAHSLTGGAFVSTYDCKGTISAGTNICVLSNPPAGTWYVMLEGTSAYTVVVEATTITRR
jgi:hypothetical protein